jgi:hypothetical protein
MGDPELMLRAQRAASELEQAWDRWRTIHGLGAEPLPPVSSYVGYSLEEPWGQPRVVFGIAAVEAEHLAALLDRHDCAGPVYAAMTSQGMSQGMMSPQGMRPDAETGARAAEPNRGRGRIHVPSQLQAGSVGRERAAEPPATGSKLDPLDPANPVDIAEPEATAGRGAKQPAAGPDGPGEGQPGLVAFRPHYESNGYGDEGVEPAPLPEQTDQGAEAAEAGRAGWARRLPGGHALPRQKRPSGAAKGSSAKQEGKERADLAEMAADLAGWAASELPGQASHRRQPRPPARPDRPGLG